MLKKFFVLLIIGLLAFTATGCAIFGDFDDDNSVVASTTLIKTKILKPKNAGGGNMLSDLRSGLRGQVLETEIVTGADVTIKLSNGETITVKSDGNGYASFAVSNLAGAQGFIIEARKGDLLVQNLVTDIAAISDLTNFETNHETTAFAQFAVSVASAAADVLATQTGVKVATLDDLINNITSISVDFSSLKREVSAEGSVFYDSYQQSLTMTTKALEQANPELETVTAGESLLEKLIKGDPDVLTTLDITETTWEESVTQVIENNEFQLPVVAPATEKEAIDAAATTFLNAFLKVVSGSTLTADEKTNLSAVLSENFIMNGMTKTVLLNSIAGEDDDLDRFEGSHSLLKIDDNTYLIHIAGTAYLKTGGSIKIDSTVEGYAYTGLNPVEFKLNALESNISEFPVVIAKQTDGSWKIMGNRIKVDEIDMELQYGLDVDQSRQFTNFWLQLDDTTSFEVESVTVSGGKIEGTGVSLTKDATIADSNAWHYWNTYTTATNGTVTHTSPYPVTGWTYTAGDHVAGTEYSFVVNFKDGTTQTFKHKVPQIPTGYAPFSASDVSINIANNKLTATWPKNTNTSLFDSYYISVWCHEEGGDSRLLEWETSDINTNTAEFALVSSSYQLITGKNYSISIHSELKNGLSQHAHKGFTVPDPTIEEARVMSSALNGALKTVAGGVAALRAPVFSAAGSSNLRAAAVDVTGLSFPTGTQFYDVYTGYAKEGTINNVFTLPLSANNITHHLMQLLDAAGNELAYTSTSPYLTGIPASMSMLVVFSDSTQGLEMDLYMDQYPLITDPDYFSLPFEAVGTVTVPLNNLEVRITSAQVGVSKQGPTEQPTAGGPSLEAAIYQNNQPYQVDGQNITITNASFDIDGLQSGYVMAGTKTVGMFARDTTGLKLIFLNEDGSNGESVYIQ